MGFQSNSFHSVPNNEITFFNKADKNHVNSKIAKKKNSSWVRNSTEAVC